LYFTSNGKITNTCAFGCCIKDIKTTIKIFYDFFDISDEKKIHSLNIQTNHMSDEEKIITALDKWESYYKD